MPLLLFVLSPLIAEYLLGNVAPSQLHWLPFLVPMYGGAAVLIREVARRTGRGWPAIAGLGAAYGLFQAAVLDGSLFDPEFMGHDFQTAAHIPGVGMSAYYAVVFVAGHAIWSICVPIALAEAAAGPRATSPWLGRRGLAATVVVFVLGCTLIALDHRATEDFTPPLWKAAAVIAACTAIGGGSLAVRRRARAASVVTPLRLALAAFVATSLLKLAPESWAGTAFALGLLAGGAWILGRRSRPAEHVLALATGAVLTQCWMGFVVLPFNDQATIPNLAGQAALVAAAVGGLAWLRRRTGPRGAAAPAGAVRAASPASR